MEKWIETVNYSTEIAIEEQEKFLEQYDFNKYKEFVFDLRTGEIFFQKDNECLLVKCQIVGGIYYKDKHKFWVWSWDDSFIGEDAKSEMNEVREFGNQRNFNAIINSLWEAEDIDALQVSSVALKILEGKSIQMCKFKKENIEIDYYFVVKAAGLINSGKLKPRRKF